MPHVNIRFYQFEKRTNSTLQPTGEGELFQCQIFDPCSMISPRIKLSFPSGAGNPTLWNYAYIGDFTRYYFVRDWTWENGLWVADLVEDCLTSWKNYIYNSTQYVLRAASTFNPTVVDTVFPAASQPGYEIVTGANPWTDNINNGTFVLSVIGSGVQGFGAASYYSLSNVAFNSLRSALLSNIDYLNISTDEISQELSKALFNPYQYIVSATWFPRAGMFQNAGMVTSSIATGWWDMSISGSAYFIDESSDTYTIYQTFRLPKHPQASERGRWLNAPPYMSYTLYMPPFGEIVLDGAILVTASEIFTTIVIDAYTGLAHLYVSLDDPAGGMPGNIISTTSAQVGVTVPLAQIAYNPIEAADNIVPLAIAGRCRGFSVLEAAPKAIRTMFSRMYKMRLSQWEAVLPTELAMHFPTSIPPCNIRAHRARFPLTRETHTWRRGTSSLWPITTRISGDRFARAGSWELLAGLCSAPMQILHFPPRRRKLRPLKKR